MKTLFYTAVFFVLMAGPCTGAYAGSDAPELGVSAGGSYIGDAGFKGTGGSAQITTGHAALHLGGLTFGYEAQKYSWDDVNEIGFSTGNDDPWDTLHQLYLSYDFEGEINNDWMYTAGVLGTSSFEKEMSGSFGAGIHGGLVHAFNQNWSAAFGAQLFVDGLGLSAMPYLGINYEDFNRDGSGAFMSLGVPSTELGYAFSKESTLRLAWAMDGRTYRLKDDSSVVKEGYIQTNSMIAGLYYDWQPTEAFALTFGPEYHFGREITRFDDEGDKTGDTIKQKSALGLTLQMSYSF